MSFDNFGFKPQLLEAIRRANFVLPTKIQEMSIPHIMKGKDVVGQSFTGSGKTAAFGLPMLNMIEPRNGVQALILTPTRELCHQVNDVLDGFAKALGIKTTSIYGGVSINPQISALRRVDVVVGTPGRILDHLERGSFDVSAIRFLVLDEVDRMADMGFIDDVERIIRQLPQKRQTMLFSATITRDVDGLVRKHVNNPEMVKAESHVSKDLLNQVCYNVPDHQKFSLLVHLLREVPDGLKLVFCATRREVEIVSKNLSNNGIRAMSIHGGLTQQKRLQALHAIKEQHVNVLVATDVAARGLDIKNVNHVYNYDVPQSAEEYTHRVGRTARAGEKGDAITLLGQRDYHAFESINRDKTIHIKFADPPEFERAKFVRQAEPRRTSHHRGPMRHGQPRGMRPRAAGFRRN